jgi:hypothetical protein
MPPEGCKVQATTVLGIEIIKTMMKVTIDGRIKWLPKATSV